MNGYEAGCLVHYSDSAEPDVGIVLHVISEPGENFPIFVVWGSDLESDQYAPNQLTRVV
ncbi:hypothetical protein OG288_15885 [Streptomyces tauricus]|uniref:Uncharacterized protein n=1 Tax=Streptomyces tauricus TaxID=68274 RepID=A0ABZ1JDG9_9ACTN|nr:hypothetical protein [Streptomyces tauricus]